MVERSRKRGYSSESGLDSGCYDSLLFGGYHVIACVTLIVRFNLRLVGVGPFEDGQRTVAARFERRGVVVPSFQYILTPNEVADLQLGEAV
jgi:hypothetical protein